MLPFLLWYLHVPLLAFPNYVTMSFSADPSSVRFLSLHSGTGKS